MPFALRGPECALLETGVDIRWEASLPLAEGVLFVERSLDGQYFEPIEEQVAAAVSGFFHTYQYLDAEGPDFGP